jgi:hypothetical protein
MRTTALLLASSVLFIATFLVIPAPCQTTSSSQRENENSVEGTVVSSTRDSLVVRTDDNQFHLFTYERDSVRAASAVRDARVRVVAGSSDENGTRVASSVTVLEAKPAEAGAAGTQAAPVPPKIREIESDIKRETRRWRAGVRAGAAFDPELFLFGVQSQMGPIFHRDVDTLSRVRSLSDHGPGVLYVVR